MLVNASPTHIRPDAGASNRASAGFSPMLMASPRCVLKPISVTAQSATGVCHAPTIWSRCVMPPTVRSPMVIRKFFAATAGRRNTRYALSFKSYWAAENACAGCFCVSSVRVVLGGLPSNTFSGKSTGLLPNSSSRTCKRPSSVAVPTTANGQRSRSQMARNLSKSSGRMDKTYRSCDSLHQICSGDMPCSSSGTSRSSKMAPRPASFTSSGKALDRPPAPTS